jgi:iron complex outermembrane receptor protein
MTETNRFEKKTVFYAATLALTLALSANPAWAQDEKQSEEAEFQQKILENEEAVDEAQDESADLGKIIVTGSRLQRETYTSIQPLQIITSEGSREAGLVEASDILQGSTAAGGQQIDLTFSGFVLDNGPGASTLSLRGLGAARTLLLLNGRRLAPSGVEGAPASPDLNLIPSSMVQRYEILLDGASSVYGSDAVAGVTNVIMRKDYDGFEGDVYYTTRDQGKGDTVTLNAAWGKNFDRGFFGLGVEYYESKAQRLRDSKWTDQCEKNREVDQNGQIRSQDLYYPNINQMPWDECTRGSLAARTYQYGVGSGSIYYTPGQSNGGWGNFSENGLYGVNVDSNGDGINDVNWQDYDLNGGDAVQANMLYPDQDRISLMGYGEYTFESEANHTAYFELNFNKRNVHSEGAGYQLFPDVPPNNPYNLCNPDGINGVDCGLAEDALLDNPGYRVGFFDRYGVYPEYYDLYNGPIGASWTEPIVSVKGDRVDFDTKAEQLRYVVGLKGDLPAIDWGAMNSWVYDMSYSYTNSDTTSSRMGVREDRLNYSLETSRFGPGGEVICGDGSAPCVPVNMYAPSLYPLGTVIGDFATQAERDYLFDDRNFRTKYKQTIFSAFADGYLFDLPGGSAMAGVGFEYRVDDINSIPDDVARDGLLFGFFSDGGAVGKKSTTEFFGELEMPILADKKFADSLVLNVSARYTSDQIYGSDTTGSAKLGWRPIPSLLLRATYGTSFRAPNLREVFLKDQSGFNNGLFDPCVVPEAARGGLGEEGYDPDLDTRDPQVLANCVADGVDPTSLGLDPNRQAVGSAEVLTGGSTELLAETSTSYTYGFAFDQPWSENFDLTFGMTYWDIDIDDTIIEPSSQFLVNDCYGDLQGNSTFCGAIDRDEDNFIDLIHGGFINRDNQRVNGIDVNLNYDQTFNIGSRAIAFSADLVMTHTKEASTTFLDDDGNENYDDDAGEWGYPDWKGQLGLRANVSDLRFSWVVNYIGKVDQDVDGIDPMSDIYDSQDTGWTGDTCLGPDEGDVLCRDVGYGDDYWLHSASVYYYGDTWTLGAGIRNVFDTSPPLVDGNEVLAVNNVPIGYGYDLRGRTFFINLAWRP